MQRRNIPEEFAEIRRLIHELADRLGVELTDEEPEEEPNPRAICGLCGGTLECREDGLIYCTSEGSCPFKDEPHPTGDYLNTGPTS